MQSNGSELIRSMGVLGVEGGGWIAADEPHLWIPLAKAVDGIRAYSGLTIRSSIT
jgi:hypothetical protein